MEPDGAASGSQTRHGYGRGGGNVAFPVTVSFAAMTFAPQFFVRDATGALIGYGTRNALFPDRTLVVYSDNSMSTPIYVFKIVSVSNFVYSFHDGSGDTLGGISFAREERKFLVKIDGDVRYEFVDETPWLENIDALIPVIPVLNAIVGLVVAPSWLASKRGGKGGVLRITKRRTMMESMYRIDLLGEIDARGRECILLASLIMIFRERLTLA